MSSELPPPISLTPLQKRALEDARAHDIEYKTSAFWQLLLQTQFPQNDNYAVICEQAPARGDSRRRVDVTVLRYHAVFDAFSPLLILEAKRRGKGKSEIKALEAQVFNRALEVIEDQGLLHLHLSINVMTVWGVKFRMWNVTAENKRLEPVHEFRATDTADEYIDIESKYSGLLAKAFERVKGNTAGDTSWTQPTVSVSQAAQASSSKHPREPRKELTQAEPGSSATAKEFISVHVEPAYSGTYGMVWNFLDGARTMRTRPETWNYIHATDDADAVWTFEPQSSGSNKVYYTYQDLDPGDPAAYIPPAR